MTTTITLDEIRAQQAKLAEMIATFEKTSVINTVCIPEQCITLYPGEHYAGMIIGQDGAKSYHLILLPGDTKADWQAAMSWAEKAGGMLPNRREQALLYANLKNQFEQAWYWSCEEHASDSDFAWGQHFYNGYQYGIRKSSEGRARAVRRLEIQ